MKKKEIVAAALATAAASTAAIAGAKLKKKEFCPICSAKTMLNKIKLDQRAETGYNNSVALTPPMGWSSWNLFARRISEDLIMEIADAMKDSGLLEAGYQYVNIDDCWQSSERDEKGRLQCDKATFPNGIRYLSDYVNSKGLKLGIYSSNGTMTCEDYPASLRREAMDADMFAQWGIEYFKYDFCHNVAISEKAPYVLSVELSKPGEKPYAVFGATEVKLSGRARVANDEGKNRKYVVGLCSRNGSFSINTHAEEPGDCVVSLAVLKADDAERFICITVNGKDEYHVYSPKSRGFGGERRIQTTVKLQKGMNTLVFDNPVGSRFDSAAIQYKLMGRELKRASREYAEKTGTEEKPIVFSLCEWGLNRPWKWGGEAGNLWRTTGDIQPIWPSVLGIYEINVRLWKYATIGAWNDPDMLEVGNGKLTYEENKSHFSLWCMMASPLILGNDVRKFIKSDGTIDRDSKVYKILTNKTMIAVDQDPLGIQCRRIKSGMVDILVKPLVDSRVAVCVFNKSPKGAQTTIDFKKISNEGFVNLPSKSGYKVYDVWEDITHTGIDRIVANTESHGVKVYIVE